VKILRSVEIKNNDNSSYAGELIHGITEETIRLPNDLAGWIEGRSRYARIG